MTKAAFDKIAEGLTEALTIIRDGTRATGRRLSPPSFAGGSKMAKHKTWIVEELPRAVYTGTDEPLTIKDPIYPRKIDVRRGSIFVFHGHSIDQPIEYVVEDILTLQTSESGRAVEASVHNVRLLDDRIVLRCERPFERRVVQFRWLSVSAAWRLKEP